MLFWDPAYLPPKQITHAEALDNVYSTNKSFKVVFRKSHDPQADNYTNGPTSEQCTGKSARASASFSRGRLRLVNSTSPL